MVHALTNPIHNTIDVGDLGDVVADVVTAGDGQAAIGDCRLSHMWNSWELHAGSSSRNKAAEKIWRIVWLLYQLLQEEMKEAWIKAALVIVRLYYR